MNLKALAEEVKRNSDEWFPGVSPDPQHHIIAISGEWGEFCNTWKKLERGDVDQARTMFELGQEMADCLIYQLILLEVLGIDVEEAVRWKLRQNEERFGNGVHVDRTESSAGSETSEEQPLSHGPPGTF